MITEIYVEGSKLDVSADISSLLTFALDDIADFPSRQTAYSKTVVLPGTANNNKIFGSIFETGLSNDWDPTGVNIGLNFNPSVSAQVIIFQDMLQTFKGTLRLIEIDIDKHRIEYQVALNGNLTALNVALSSALIEDLDFSEYDHIYSIADIVASWSNPGGSGVFYPHIDHGTYSTGKHDWSYLTFRPALYAKEYIDKMFAATGNTTVADVAGQLAGNAAEAAALAGGATATAAQDAYNTAYDAAYLAAQPAALAGNFRYQCDLFNTPRFKSLIIPHNQKALQALNSLLLTADVASTRALLTSGVSTKFLNFDTATGSIFTIGANTTFTYNGTTILPTFTFAMNGTRHSLSTNFTLQLWQNNIPITGASLALTSNHSTFDIDWDWSNSFTLTMNPGDVFKFYFQADTSGSDTNYALAIEGATLTITTPVPILTPVLLGDTVQMNAAIPQNIRQVDFLVSIVKLFNLYVYEDQFDDHLMHITPFVDFFASTTDNVLDWTYKMDRNQVIKIKPMSELNSRIYNFNYADDTDYWNDLYNKRYNQSYGSYIFDSLYEFATETNKLELTFAPTPLVGYGGEDKVYPTIFKRSGTTEETIDSVIRIMQTKTLSCSAWNILSTDDATAVAVATTAGTNAYNAVLAGGGTVAAATAAYNVAFNASIAANILGTFSTYAYAGHFDDPNNPDNDLNFGALNEVFFILVSGDLSQTQFNVYWSAYMAEITDKDSKLLTAQFYLRPIDIFNLDFSKFIVIDGTLFRLNKITDFNATIPGTCEVELLKVINSAYTFPIGGAPAADRTLDWETGDELEYTPGIPIFYF